MPDLRRFLSKRSVEPYGNSRFSVVDATAARLRGRRAEKSIEGAIDGLAKELKLSDNEIHQLLPSGKQSMFSNKVHLARFYLTKAGALERTKHAHFAITELGKKLLVENPKEINVAILGQFPEFLAFLAPKVAGEDEPAVETSAIRSAQTTATPEEAI